MLAAIPDVHFDLTNIVIGPQGVSEEAHVTGTFEQDWLTFKATGGRVAFDVMILFPWNAEAQLFNGERVFVIGLGAEAAGAAGAGG
jgi:predicted ester cyclase